MSGNWKMYKTPAETTAFFEKFRPLVEKSSHCEIVICPPFTNLAAAVDAVKGLERSRSARRISAGPRKAPSPAKSPAPCSTPWASATPSSATANAASTSTRPMRPSSSARRPRSNSASRRSSASANFWPTAKSGNTEAVLAGQFQKGIAGLTEQQFAKIVIAYEPVWAIGTGKTATPEIAADTHRAIRAQVRGEIRQGRRRCGPHPVRRQRQAR